MQTSYIYVAFWKFIIRPQYHLFLIFFTMDGTIYTTLAFATVKKHGNMVKIVALRTRPNNFKIVDSRCN